MFQDAERNAGFAIGGTMKYTADYSMEERRNNRKARKTQRIGVSAQRFNDIRAPNIKNI